LIDEQKATITKLQNQQNELIVQLNAMMSKYTDLLTRVMSIPTSITIKNSKFNATVPDLFDRIPERTKAFFHQLYLYFTAQGMELDTAKTQVYFTLSHMKKGLAKSWAG
jgi:hypothetical protein